MTQERCTTPRDEDERPTYDGDKVDKDKEKYHQDDYPTRASCVEAFTTTAQTGCLRRTLIFGLTYDEDAIREGTTNT